MGASGEDELKSGGSEIRKEGLMGSRMGTIPPHPRCFPKSGKQRTCGIRNVEERREDGRRGAQKPAFPPSRHIFVLDACCGWSAHQTRNTRVVGAKSIYYRRNAISDQDGDG